MAGKAGRLPNGQFAPGHNGGPGRPKKEFSLTQHLVSESRKSFEVDGKRMAGYRLVARQIWDGLATGKVTFLDGSERRLTAKDWKDLMEFAYDRIDGKPTQRNENTGAEGGPMEIVLTWPDGRPITPP